MFKSTAALAALFMMVFSTSALAQARLAVLHLAPFADTAEGTSVSISANGTVLFEDVKFKDFVDYTSLPAGEYTIDITPTGSMDPAISATVVLADGSDYTAFAVGNGVTQDLELMAVLDTANTPTDPMNVAVRVIHAAPFAMELPATEVSIRTAGGDVVNGLVGVPYKGNSGFFEIPAGEYDLKVASNDGSVNLIDPLPATLPAGAGVTLFAFGDGINQDLGILAFPVGSLPLRTPVDSRSTGIYAILEGSGTGYNFQPLPAQNRVVGSWLTYDAGGNPTFLTFQSDPGAFDGVNATTTLYQSMGGGSMEDDEVVLTPIGEIDFEILTCVDAIATVRIDGMEAQVYTAKQLTGPVPCTDTP